MREMKDMPEPFSPEEIRHALYEYVVWLLYAAPADFKTIRKEILTVKRVLDIVDLRIKEEAAHGGPRKD